MKVRKRRDHREKKGKLRKKGSKKKGKKIYRRLTISTISYKVLGFFISKTLLKEPIFRGQWGK